MQRVGTVVALGVLTIAVAACGTSSSTAKANETNHRSSSTTSPTSTTLPVAIPIPPTTPPPTVPALDTGATPTGACFSIFRAVVAVSRVDEFFDRLYLKSTDDCLDVNDWLVTAVQYPEVIGGSTSAAALARELAIVCGKKPASRVCIDPRAQNIITNFGP